MPYLSRPYHLPVPNSAKMNKFRRNECELRTPQLGNSAFSRKLWCVSVSDEPVLNNLRDRLVVQRIVTHRNLSTIYVRAGIHKTSGGG